MSNTNKLIQNKKFSPGKDWVWYAPHTHDVFAQPEIDAVMETLKDGWLTTGKRTAEFERQIGEIFGKKHSLFVNSGSSANLIALAVLKLPKGSEVITPACNFNTTVAPIVQNGLTPVFVDVKEGFYTVDARELVKAITKKTRAMILPHLIGNLIDLSEIKKIAKAKKIILIEDSCDTIGSTWMKKPTGNWSDITTTSFYASHVITSGGAGGMVMFNDPKLRESARIFRDWGRGITKHDDQIRSRLGKFKINDKPYDSAFVFVEQGYNMRPTEIQAAFGLKQLERLGDFMVSRKKVFDSLHEFFSKHLDNFIIPQQEKEAEVNWLAFPLTIQKGSKIKRNELVKYLEDHKIQTRPLFAGNVVKHPAYKKVGRSIGKLPVSNHILENSFLIGAHHGMTDEMVDYVKKVFTDYINNL